MKEELGTDQRGMTLVEILVVIVLIALVMGVVAKGVISKGDTAKAKLNVVKMEKVKSALDQYRLEYNSYPSKLEDLVKPPTDTSGGEKLSAPFADEDDLKDIWKNPYIYHTENNNRSYTLKSLGSDGLDGGEGSKQDVTLTP